MTSGRPCEYLAAVGPDFAWFQYSGSDLSEFTHFRDSALTPGGDFNRARPQGSFECLTPEQKLKTAA